LLIFVGCSSCSLAVWCFCWKLSLQAHIYSWCFKIRRGCNSKGEHPKNHSTKKNVFCWSSLKSAHVIHETPHPDHITYIYNYYIYL
jgi:hypothetical protein